jgi:ribosome-binding protein aMBF1 (putative translation factor)
MKKPTFAEFIREVEAEAHAEGPEAIAQLEVMRQRYYLGSQIAMLRKRQKLTQPALAKRSGLEQADISRIERGSSNPTEDTLARLGRALGVRLAFVDKKNKVAAA